MPSVVESPPVRAPGGATVRSISARAVRLPLAEPHRTASGVITESPLVLVDAISSEGVIGHALVFTYTPAALRPTTELLNNLAAWVEGEPLAPLETARALRAKVRLLGAQGLVGMALAGIDMALWDALARLHEVPLVRLLGGSERPLRAYGAVGYDGVEGTARTAEAWAARGFRGVKAKIGYPSLEQDLAVVRSMRAAAGPEMAIMVDYNQSLDPVEAERRLRALDAEGLAWIEEPVAAHDHRGQARLSRAVHTPIQCGENWWGLADMQQSLAAAASDLVMPDVMKIGGVSGWLGAAALADAACRPLSSHLWPEISARLLCLTPTAHWLEYVDWWNPLLKQPLRIEQGEARVDDEPGSGIDWDEAVVARHLA